MTQSPFINPDDLHHFYEGLVRTLRGRGAVCGITSGLACVHYGVAETTKDCDLLCHETAFPQLLDLLNSTPISAVACQYRGNISPPLDARWHRGGWTSHFEWPLSPEKVTLDVFGHALRESQPWAGQLIGLYAAPQTVAEMKRTHRDKDWAFITALGVRMIEADDTRGWLHIFSPEIALELLHERSCPAELLSIRPALKLASSKDPQTAGAINAERRLWEELDRRRIRILETHLRPYVAAVRIARQGRGYSLFDEHSIRLDCASQHLPYNPLKEYGLNKYVEETRTALVDQGLIPGSGLSWLPDVRNYFEWLNV
jgi:hypothetical protein